ncbi:MAG TPA: type II toxin-antitoxin system VapC family toxin [Gemmataceae bacterium]|nr:type II toxin-antitoxin system VapC family toxin [Gemmataceae bacterium]
MTDTDILIDALHGLPLAINFLVAQRAGGGLGISVITAMELVVGCRNTAELANLRQFLAGVTTWPVDVGVSQRGYQLMESFCLSHGLTIPDSLIAATALERGLTLYTRNVRHFQMIPGLAVTRPY